MNFCPACGNKVSDGMSFCPSCGARLTPYATTGAGAAPASGAAWSKPFANDQAAFYSEIRALGKIRLFVIIVAVGILIGFAAFGLFYFVLTISAERASISNGGSLSSFFSHLYPGIVAVTGIGIALTIVALLQLRSAFKNLTAVDQEGFSLPSTLTLLPILAEPLILVGLALFLGGFGSFAGTAVQAQQGTSNSSAVASSLLSSGALWLFFAGIAVYSVAGLVSLVGLVGGPVLGLWRVGSRYDEATIKAASILYIIPLVQLLSPILLWVGVGSAIKRLKSARPEGALPNS